MIVIPSFCPEWEKHSRTDDTREEYVSQELRRLFEEKGVVLLAVLQQSVADDARMIALRQLSENQDADGTQLYDPTHLWRLKLKDDAKPPLVDAQGRKLPKEKAGKVLVTKVGNLGGQRSRDQSTAASREWAGDRRAMKSNTGQDLYSQREVTSKPAAFPLNDAVLILQRFGIAVQTKQYLRDPRWKPGDANEDLPNGQDQWLVEEVPPAGAKADKSAA
jgi:hypothetical protein